MDDSQKKQQQSYNTDQTPIQSGQAQQSTASQQDLTQAVQNQKPVQQLPSQPEDLPATRQEKKEEVPVAPASGLSPAEPISAPSKESGPAQVTSEKLVVPSQEKMQVSSELQEIGIEAKDDMPKLTPEDAQAGIVHAKEATPVVMTDQPSIQLPMSQQQAQQTVKMHKKVKDSLFWFAMLILRQWQIALKNKKSNINN